MTEKRSRALVFGGAFNPPTRAHIDLAEFAMRESGRDSVIFVPSKSRYISEFQGKDFAFAEEERLNMLKRIATNRPWMRVSDDEIRAERQPRTYETLCLFRERGVECSLLIGSDKLVELSTMWRFVPEICREFGVVCMARGTDDCEAVIRGDALLSSLADCIEIIDSPADFRGVSSTAARQAILTGDRAALRGMLPEELWEIEITKSENE